MIKDSSNCWNTLKLDKPQRNNSCSYKRDGDESRKNYLDSVRLNPKHYCNRQSAAKPAKEGSTTIRKE